MEKFLRAYEGLKSGGTIKKKDSALIAKEKISNCQALMEAVQNQQFKQHADFVKQFGAAFEILFTLCDDSNLDVRVYVDECLNTIIRRNLSEGSAVRIHYELFQEIKRNGPARCLRSALSKFADLAHLIRPNRCRTFAKNLVSCFVAIVRRPEESVQECLGSVVEKMFAVLGRFLSDEEIKILIKSLLPSLQLQSAAARRTAALFLVELCRNSRKRYAFVSYLFKALLDTLVPVQFDQSVLQLLGTFFTFRLLIPALKACEDENDAGQELRVTQTGTITLRPSTSLTTEHLLQLYEAIIYYLNYPDSSVVTAALETLNHLLQHCPAELLRVLLCETDGMGKSRIFTAASNMGTLSSRSRKGSVSGLRSGVSSLGGSQNDLSIMALGDLSIDDPPLFAGSECASPLPLPAASSGPRPDSRDDDSPLSMIATYDARLDRPTLDDRTYSSIQMGELLEDALTDVQAASSVSFESSKTNTRGGRNLAPLNLPESTANIEPIFNDPTSPMSPLFSKDVCFPDDIGSFADSRPPARYCSRFLCRKFLLDGSPGHLIADKAVRVSHKVLALGCLDALCSLYPTALEDSLCPLLADSQRISDVLLFSDHEDPQIKGNVALLASSWLKSAMIFAGRKTEALSPQVTCEVVRAMSTALLSDSGVAARLAVQALTNCYRELLEYDVATCLRFLKQAASLSGNPYWLLKVAVAELLAEIDYCSVSSAELSALATAVKEEERFYAHALDKLVNTLLADDDHRVRHSASMAVVGLVDKLCLNSVPAESSFLRRCDRLSHEFEFSWHLTGFAPVHSLVPAYKLRGNGNGRSGTSSREYIEENLACVIDLVIKTLCRAVDKSHTIGCLTALHRLAESFPPTSFEAAWCSSARREAPFSIELLSMLVSILKSISFGSDTLVVHQTLFALIGSLFAGAALSDMQRAKSHRKVNNNQSQTNDHWPALATSKLGEFAYDLFNYCLRTLSIYWHVVSEQVPAPPPVLTKPPLPQLPQAASFTPVTNKLKAVTGGKSESKSSEANAPAAGVATPLPSTKFKAADFYSSMHFMRVFEMVNGAWSNYKISLDSDVEEKFCALLRSCLNCLNCLLEVGSFGDVERFTEELLAYLKPLMPILSAEVVTAVVQLLKSLFGTNLTLSFQSNQSYPTAPGSVGQSGAKIIYANSEQNVYHSCIVKQRAKFFSQITSSAARHDACAESLKQHLGWFGSRGERHVLSLLKNSTHKATLTNYIRLFEPTVVQGLRLYTSSVSVDLQCAVIGLLSQLVQIRVNYSLLDTDKRFLEFLCQQLENMEDGHDKNLEILARKLFEFFVLLSYEKYHSVPVLEIPKILQLADGLLASSHNGKGTGYLGVLSLHPVVLDLYFFRSASKVVAMKELEIQQEVVVSILIKCIRCGGGALSLLSFVLYQSHKESESKWRKLSRDVVDALLVLLGKNQMPLKNVNDVSCLFGLSDFLCASAFRPVDPILSLMLTSPSPSSLIQEFCSWLACEIWCVRSLIIHSNEAAIVSRLEEMPSAVVGATWLLGRNHDSGFVDPLGSTLRKDFEEIFARLLLSVAKVAMERLRDALVDRPTSPILLYLEQLCNYYISTLVHLCQCSDYAKFSASFSSLVAVDTMIIDECIARCCPELATQWFCLLSTLKAYDTPSWKLASAYGISPVLRRCITMLYCDCIKTSIMSQAQSGASIFESFLSNNSDIFEWYDEPPVKDLMRIALGQPETCNLVLSELADVFEEEPCIKPSRAVKLLQCLEMANADASVFVLDIATRVIVRYNLLAVTKMAGALALKKLDMLMVNRAEETKSVLSANVLIKLISRFDTARRRRFAVLYGRLDQLARAWYPNEYESFTLGKRQDVEGREMLEILAATTTEGPLPSPAKFNRVKYLEFLQAALRSETRKVNFCLEALRFLSVDDVTEVLADEKMSAKLLVACLTADCKEYENAAMSGQSSPSRRRTLSEIADAARRCLLGAIRTILASVPKDFRPIFTTRDYSVVGDCEGSICDKILDLASGVHRLFENARLRSTLTESELRVLISYLVVVVTVYLKRLSSIKLCHARRLAAVFTSSLCNEHFCRVLATTDFIEHQSQLIGGSFWLCYKALNVRSLMAFVGDLSFVVEDGDIRPAWQYCNAFLHWMESLRPGQLPLYERVAKSLFVGLCRLPCVTSFTHVPPSAFKFGWTPELKVAPNGYASLPTVPVHYLQNVDTLREFIYRVSLLGWSSRQQFEEIWMGLLGVLSATTIGRELLNNSVQETEDRIVASSFAVRCLSSLLLQTLLSPTPGNPSASTYVFKPRERQRTFLTTTFGTKLNQLRRSLRYQMTGAHKNVPLFGFNPERLHSCTKYSVGQLSIETLWSLTGILAEERDLLSGLPQSSTARSVNASRVSEAYEATTSVETPDRERPSRSSRGGSFHSYTDELTADARSKAPSLPEEFMAVRRSTSNFLLISESGLDLVSCLHFLLDLFTHWFAGGPDDIPLVLLSATVESVLYLSDLFTERSQYVWLREHLLTVYQNRSIDDELMLQDLLLGLLKCSAVLGINDVEKQKEIAMFIDIGLHNPQLSVRLATVDGVLYVLQALTSDETITLMPLLTDYVAPHISIILNDDAGRSLEKPQSLEHQLVVWALGFYIVEAFHDPHTKASFATKFTELCFKAMEADSMSSVLFDCVINGLESLLVTTPLDDRLVGQLTKAATKRVQKPTSPQAGALAMELLLTCLYTSKENQRFGDAATPDSDIAPRTVGEPHISAMERLAVLLNRVTEGSRLEASAVGSILPDFLADHFSPSDVLNKVIVELLNPVQPHPQVLLRALHSLIETLLQQEVPAVVCDWIVVSLPSFTCKNPVNFSIWALTCLLLSASTNSWVKALWPLAMSRYNARESELDSRLFCFAISAFRGQLSEKSQVDSLIQTIRKAAERHPHSAYTRALGNLLDIGNQAEVTRTASGNKLVDANFL